MAIKLASLGVELTLNAAQFVTGFEATRKEFKAFSSEVTSSLSELGSVAGEALGTVGAFGGEVGATLSAVAQSATGLFSAFSRLGGPLAMIGGVGAAAGVVMAGVSAATIGLAVHAAEAAAKLEDLSHATGVSVETLSKLQMVGHMIAPDVGVDQIAKALERMDRAALKAASASSTTITPFQRMGIAVKDSSGQMRSGEAIFADLATKFAAMQDGAVKTGLAMEIFGRGGAAMLPILDEGGEKIQKMIELGEQLGVVIGTETAEAAHKFKENLSTLELVFQGVENKIMEAMLPALTELTNRLVAFFSETTPQREKLIHDLADMATAFLKLAIVSGEALRLIANNLGAIVDIMEIFSHGERSLGTVLDQAGKRTVQWAKDTVSIIGGLPSALSIKAGPKTPFDQLDDLKDRLKTFDRAHSTSGVNLQSDAAHQAQLTIQEQIRKLEGQAEAEGLLANAISSVSSATLEATAHAEALRTISNMNAQAQKYGISVTAEQAQKIEEATLRLDAYKAALNVNKELEAQTTKTELATKSLLDLASAYRQGGAAVATAEESAKLEPLIKKVEDLQEVLNKLGQKPITGKLAEEFNTLGKALDQAKQKLSTAQLDLHSETIAKYTAEQEKEKAAISGSIPFVERLNDAFLRSDEAVRQARIALELYNYQASHPGATTDQVEAQRQIYEERSKQEHDLHIAEEAGQYNLQRILSDTNTKYAAIKETLESMGESTLLVDAAIYDANERIIKQWDDAAFKVGTLKEKFGAFLNELVLQGQNLGAKVFGSMLQAVDSLESELAKLLTGEKTNFAAIGRQLEQSVLKAQMQAVIGQAAGALDKLFPGLHAGDLLKGKPDGTQSNPLYVSVVNAAAAGGGSVAGTIFGGGGGQSGGGGGLFGGLLGKIFGGGGRASSTPTMDVLDQIDSGNDTGGGGGGGFLSAVGGFFGKIAGLFGGGMADGGDMDPGKWYITGEKHPEIIAPKRPMSVYARMPQATGTEGQAYSSAPVFNFHGVQDMDTFKRNKGQMAAWSQQTMYSAHVRHS